MIQGSDSINDTNVRRLMDSGLDVNVRNNDGKAALRSFGVMNESQLILEVAIGRQLGERVVMTNGIFDILHAGHVSYLANARKLADRLIVAVNSDASTRHLKGEKRPINTLLNRMIVLDALESVDWIISFEEDTPQRLIAKILPDVLVKGGEYRPEDIAGSKEVWVNGGKVLALNFENGISTSHIIQTVINRYFPLCELPLTRS